MDLLERYNNALRNQEDVIIHMLERVLTASFQRLVRRVRIHLRAGEINRATRNILILQELRQLVPASRPDSIDPYDRLFQNLIRSSSKLGLNAAEVLAQNIDKPRIDATVPIEAVVNAASRARGYLQRWGNDFAFTAAEIVAQGIAEGRPFDAMVLDMQNRLSVVQTRAATIVRTESLRAYNDATNTYYVQNNIREVMWYATADDRSCPTCAPRAGQIYKRGEVSVPLHPQCRCYLAPWDEDIAIIDPGYAASRLTHRKEVLAAFRKANPENGKAVSLSRARVFGSKR